MDNNPPSGNLGKKIPKPNNIIQVPAGIDTGLFRWWLIFLRPIIKLTDREIDVVSSFLHQRYLLSKNIQDPILLDKVLMSDDIKKTVMEECKITLKHFYVIMSELRKHGVIKDSILNPRLIPNIRQDDNGVFQLLILFKA